MAALKGACRVFPFLTEPFDIQACKLSSVTRGEEAVAAAQGCSATGHRAGSASVLGFPVSLGSLVCSVCYRLNGIEYVNK